MAKVKKKRIKKKGSVLGTREAIESIVPPNGGEELADFNMGQLYAKAWPLIEQDAVIAKVVERLKKLGEKNYKKLAYAVLRAAFLIELVKKPKIETTKFRVRWIDELKDDPRGCSSEECLLIAEDLLTQLPDWFNANKEQHGQALLLSFDHSLLAYEAPLDYQLRLTPTGRLHARGNLVWFFDPPILRTLKLRQFLTSPLESPDAAFFRSVLVDKIRIKTYLTDRVLTGDHKTNREKRWETHPKSVHFAERRTCMAIEYALVTQVCRFEGFPKEAVASLQKEKILPAELPTALCPITGDSLSYESFREELLNPKHGKSDFQVGHVNPLKLGEEGGAAGHTAENISWISADGNRIQGSLSLDDVRELIQRISENYDRLSWWPRKKTKK
jgi:hypothetical protein